jgi:UDP-3-O-[3-hydroxymyristoyl] N-acetylglucosamine deacetylase
VGNRVNGTSFRQTTLKSSIRCNGVGLHSGEKIAMTLYPAEPGTGITFRRTDLGGAEIPARFENVVDTRLCTTIANEDGASVGTVEHLLAAFSGCEVDNAVVELDGPEVPIMDGSAEPFVFLIDCAGLVSQNAPRRAIRILRPVTVDDDGREASLKPSEGFSVSLDIDFDNPRIGKQELTVEVTSHLFKAEICRARTFGFLHEVEALRQSGLALGGSLDNAVVLSGDEILNEGGLRYTNEFVRHKVLDCIGDLYLAGGPLIGHYSGRRTGHAIHNKLLRALFADAKAWTWTSLEETVVEPTEIEAAWPAPLVAATA